MQNVLTDMQYLTLNTSLGVPRFACRLPRLGVPLFVCRYGWVVLHKVHVLKIKVLAGLISVVYNTDFNYYKSVLFCGFIGMLVAFIVKSKNQLIDSKGV